MGVYTVTQYQWNKIKGDRPATFKLEADWRTRPIEGISYYQIRENSSNAADANYSWPGKGHAVHPESFMGILRARANDILKFDLPTEAQWEYACRAGTSGPWNNGSDPTLLSRYADNGGKVPEGYSNANVPADLGGTARVGTYLPNTWGLYEMHGNVNEWCLDWFKNSDPSMAGDDPVGPASGSARTRKGGRWTNNQNLTRSAARYNSNPNTTANQDSIRVTAEARILIEPPQ